MRELPSGTVTFLFTDIEGSTRLLHDLGDAYAAALAEHRRVLREVFARHSGVEVDTQGDAFFVAFPRASDALAAAAEGQDALARGPLRVRMGLHTGEPTLTDEGYVGMDVHRAARIASAGQGGQVVLSQTTRDLAGGHDLRDLGEHRLKDLSAPERLYQLGKEDFAPLKTLGRTNLPVPATAFLGRERDLQGVVTLLRRSDVRLLTLVGPGGTGKSRLALQAAGAAADHYRDGVFWVPLAPLRDPQLVLEAVGEALGTHGGLAEHIADKRLLLLLDNFEHVIEAAADVAGLLAACPNLDVLVTSRELLQLASEQTYPVPPLDVADGAQLFLARARALNPHFAVDGAVQELCERLDQLPLAIELAAARTRHLSARQLLERLTHRLDVLKGGRDVDPRQRTLRSTIEWSYDLLSPDERTLFARLAVFTGGWTLDAVETICGADLDTLGSLVDKSLVRNNQERYWLLETIREYAAEKLEVSQEADVLRRRHGEHFLRLAEGAGLNVESVEAGAAPHLAAALADLDNFRAALDWGSAADPLLALRLAVALEQLWVSNHPFEGARRLGALLARCDGVPLELRAQSLRALGGALQISGQLREAMPYYEHSRDLYQGLGNERGVSHLTQRLAITEIALGNRHRGRALAEECLTLARAIGSRLDQAAALACLATIEDQEGNYVSALELQRRSIEVSRSLAFPWFQAIGLMNVAELLFKIGDVDEADVQARAALELSQRSASGRQNMVFCLSTLALVASARGDNRRAGRLWGAILAEEQRGPIGEWESQARNDVAARLGDAMSREFQEGVAAGQLLTLDQAVEEVLRTE